MKATIQLQINKDQTKVRFLGEDHEIQTDMQGDFYFLFTKDKITRAVYFKASPDFKELNLN